MFGFFRTRLFNNIMHLTLIQGVAFILPLMAFPYLVKVLGMDHYGKFIFYQLIVQYITLCSDFGFNFLATQKIAKNQCNLYKVTVIFWTTLWSKTFLISLLLSVLWAIVFTIDIKFDYILFFMFLPQLIAGVLMPTWLFQGKEEMKILSFATIGIRAVNVALIFLLVKHYNDINTVALIQSLCSFFLVIVVYFYIYKKRWIGFYYFKYSRIIFFIKSSFPYFISVISVNLYTSFPAFIIGITLGTQSVAYYNIANTIRNAMQSLLNPIYQSLFPRINNIYSVNKDAAKKLIKRSLLIVSCLVFIFSIFVFIFSPLVIQLITS
ncbi:TPA: oligosaccharide flippase family protein, partial [Escherichia coli]|nr:oligosaccharide flippase family protein [Escherichia coli]